MNSASSVLQFSPGSVAAGRQFDKLLNRWQEKQRLKKEKYSFSFN